MVVRNTAIIAAAAVVLAASATAAWAQRDGRRGFDPRPILERMDANRNGVLEPSEISPRARHHIDRAARRAGLDPSRPIPIEALLRGREGDSRRPASSSSSSRSDSSRSDSTGRSSTTRAPESKAGKPSANPTDFVPPEPAEPPSEVPGFGEEFGISPPPGFGEDADAADAAGRRMPIRLRYSSRVLDYVEKSILDRYDKDRSGALEREEWRSVRWSSDPSRSDTNGDGTLSKEELCRRIAGRWRSYAESMMRRYDKNKSGVLEADELKSMRGDPEKSDANRDGVLTLDELTNHMGAYNDGRSRWRSPGRRLRRRPRPREGAGRPQRARWPLAVEFAVLFVRLQVVGEKVRRRVVPDYGRRCHQDPKDLPEHRGPRPVAPRPARLVRQTRRQPRRPDHHERIHRPLDKQAGCRIREVRPQPRRRDYAGRVPRGERG